MNAEKRTDLAAKYAIAIAQAIHDLGSVPEGHLYARLMDKLDLSQFTALIDCIVNTGLVKRSPSHLLTWEGSAS